MALLLSLMSAVVLPAQNLRFESRDNRVGNADQFGYVRIVRELGMLPSGNGGRNYPITLVFTSDPEQKPGLLGPGWRFPIIDSTVYSSNRGTLVWEAPDEYRRFFVFDKEARTHSGETAYRHQGGEWNAVVNDRHGTVLITGMEDPEFAYEYRDGRLVRFRLGQGATVYSVNYIGRDLPHSIIAQGNRDPVFSVQYRGSSPESISVGSFRYDVELGQGDWTAPDGKGNYSDYRVQFLTKLHSGDDNFEKFTYSKDEPRIRKIEASERFLPVNRLALVDAEGKDSWVSFEARSGFVVADSGGNYSVTNPAYDPHQRSKDSRRVSPGYVNITRNPDDGGSPQQWSRDWSKGIETYTEPDGSLMRRTWIIAEGPAYGKLRKLEEYQNDGGGWNVVERRSYTSRGELARLLNPNEGTIMTYDYGIDGRLLGKYVNGSLVQRRNYSDDGLLEYVENYNSSQIDFVFLDKDGKVTNLLKESNQGDENKKN
ncbi:hypothetical protein [Cerasicoccus arenae]|uniref:hypothetical protein n=1 Tax=Cerasicoccus arenae TaxID=424488 RepID=UPI0016722884|nr:hypothetical protein [Cerasicoccus arenae]MBK1857844.1 hypothetical protein [Cerasicoccus arenae]